MNLLLDTHVFIWWDSDPDKLSQAVLEAIKDKSNTLFLSVISVLEMQIKKDIGKLTLRIPLANMLLEQEKKNQIKLLSLESRHILALEGLPLHHKDPFDRVIIAQANIEDLTLISYDSIFANYSVRLFS